MNADPSSSVGASWPPRTPAESLQRLVSELERWGELFLRLAAEDKPAAAEQVLGGLVDWMGNGLMDGWLHLPLPLFEKVSDLAEELLQAFQEHLAWLRGTAAPRAADGHSRRDDAIRDILARARALTQTCRSCCPDHGPSAGPR